MEEQKKYEWIESYLANTLTEEERLRFEQEMRQDADLSTEVSLHRDLSDAINEQAEIHALKNRIQEVMEGENQLNSASSKTFFITPLCIAAAILLLFIGGLVANWYMNTSSHATQLAEQYVDYPTSLYQPGTLRTTNPEGLSTDYEQKLDVLWTKVNVAYQKQDYAEGLQIMEELASFQREKDSGLFPYAQGILLAQKGELQAAIVTLQKVQSEYTDEANWKRAMLLLSLPAKRAKALALLRQIAQANVPRSQQAKVILEQLD